MALDDRVPALAHPPHVEEGCRVSSVRMEGFVPEVLEDSHQRLETHRRHLLLLLLFLLDAGSLRLAVLVVLDGFALLRGLKGGFQLEKLSAADRLTLAREFLASVLLLVIFCLLACGGILKGEGLGQEVGKAMKR
jgi:hypothetical protein